MQSKKFRLIQRSFSLKVILLSLSFFLYFGFFPISNLSAQDLIEERNQLDQIYKKLQVQLWTLKKNQLRERQLIKDQIDFSDERIRTLYERRNSLVEEEFLIEENISQAKENLNDFQQKYQTLQGQISQTIERETLNLQAMFPVAIENYSDTLNQIKSIPVEKNIEKKIIELINYKLNLINQGKIVEVYSTKIYQPNLKDSLPARVLRVGWIQSYYEIIDPPQEINPFSILIRESDLSGIRYRWEEVPQSAQKIVEQSIHQGVNVSAQNKKDVFEIPVDPIQSGKKLRSFLNTQSSNWFKRFSDFFISGGIIMYPLFFLLFWALFLIVEKAFQMSQYRMKKIAYLDEVIKELQTQSNLEREHAQEQIQKIISKEKSSDISSILTHLINHLPPILKEGEKLIQDQFAPLIFKLERRLATLSVIATVAPLLGLLGTVTGMIQLFDVITLYGTSNPKILAGGISIALVTTQTGLAIAVPILISHHFLTRIKNKLLVVLETKFTTILNLLYQSPNQKS